MGQMRETKIIPLTGKLPRGAIAQLSRKYGMAHSTISFIASGKIINLDIYAEMVEMAAQEQKKRQRMEVLIEKAELL